MMMIVINVVVPEELVLDVKVNANVKGNAQQ
jgi:hypothetical protein